MYFRKTVSKKYIELRKIENFVRSKYYPEIMSKVNGKRANFRQPCQSFKIIDRYLTYKRKRVVIFGTDRNISVSQYHSNLP